MDSSLHNITNIDLLKVLICSGANVDEANNRGFTALMWASYYGRANIVKLLIDMGADVNKANIYGDTTLMIALRNGHANVVELLEKK